MIVKKSLLLGLTIGAIALTATPTFSQSSSTSKDAFQCGVIEGKRHTFAYNANTQKKTALINWESKYIDSKTDINKACDNAVEILKNRSEILIGVEMNTNNPMVVCIIDQEGDTCSKNPKNQLFVLQKTVTEQSFKTDMSEIFNSAWVTLDNVELVRGSVGQMYTQIKSRAWWDLF
ncbi:hypothetical protein [Trichormus variabilis]|uniref:Uncharacterized protein n=1 Tax=Trichormus variabilis SAG 1403-4b TaxID=447716 RepID=A0A433V097_ANAVA|nr:hypothetical protein [Trichormus variabilis]MBD2625141.1 hypothetical protein [Trichormus variabilis FACHB-164]RUS99512.1 hypothetical protein DSM107003_00960 [Trichormus variabilis SAG 1403-4b]